MWFYGEGETLPFEPQFDTTLAQKAYELASRWDTSRTIDSVADLPFKESDLEGFDSNQISAFISS